MIQSIGYRKVKDELLTLMTQCPSVALGGLHNGRPIVVKRKEELPMAMLWDFWCPRKGFHETWAVCLSMLKKGYFQKNNKLTSISQWKR